MPLICGILHFVQTQIGSNQRSHSFFLTLLPTLNIAFGADQISTNLMGLQRWFFQDPVLKIQNLSVWPAPPHKASRKGILGDYLLAKVYTYRWDFWPGC